MKPFQAIRGICMRKHSVYMMNGTSDQLYCNVILQHPVALCRFYFSFTFALYMQLLLMFTLLILFIVIYTTCFVLIGHTQLYKLFS
jgi:hypothetical protein